MIPIVRGWLSGLVYTALLKRGAPLRTMGGACAWAFVDAELNERSIVYSGGVGHDISFEKELVRTHRCSVWLFDPSVTGRRTMEEAANRVPRIHFLPVGLSGTSGDMGFRPPSEPGEGSFTLALPGRVGVRLPCRDLQSLMADFGHDRIDLLKLDIEGFEYGVLEQVIGARLDVRQICVEFHHQPAIAVGRWRKHRQVVELLRHGYSLMSRRGNDFTFLVKGKAGRPS